LAIKKGLEENACSQLFKTASSIVALFGQSLKKSNALQLYLQQTGPKQFYAKLSHQMEFIPSYVGALDCTAQGCCGSNS